MAIIDPKGPCGADTRSAAFAFVVGLIFICKINIKGSGQEYPLYTVID